ncbi:MAG: MYXO-CTERM sorting domain-containing protein [Phycisphaerales bacterium]
MNRARFALVAIAALAGAGIAQADIVMSFEEIPGDVQPINNFYTGVTFGSSSTGSPMVTRRTSIGNYNTSNFDDGTSNGSGNFWIFGDVGATSALDGSGNDGRISFDNQNATFVTLRYSCSSTFTMEAYTALGVLIDTDSGPANLRVVNNNEAGPGLLRVDWNGVNHIAYVIVHDTGNFWVIDNVVTDATGITPAPGAAALLGLGGLIVGRRRR